MLGWPRYKINSLDLFFEVSPFLYQWFNHAFDSQLKSRQNAEAHDFKHGLTWPRTYPNANCLKTTFYSNFRQVYCIKVSQQVALVYVMTNCWTDTKPPHRKWRRPVTHYFVMKENRLNSWREQFDILNNYLWLHKIKHATFGNITFLLRKFTIMSGQVKHTLC